MTPEPDWDLLESHELIRKAAFALAYSGVFTGWEGVWLTMRSRFGAEQLAATFDSPFFRLDLDRHCDQGRSHARIVDCRGMWSSPAVQEDSAQGSRTSAPPENREKRPPGRRLGSKLPGRIVAVLDDVRPRTALEIAQQLDVGRNEVTEAMRTLLAERKARVSGYATCAHGGRAPRLFTSDGMTVIHRKAEVWTPGTPGRWPDADPVLTSAIQAIVRQHRGDAA